MNLLDRLFNRAKPAQPPVPSPEQDQGVKDLERLLESMAGVSLPPTGLPDAMIRKIANTYLAGVNGFAPACPCDGCMQVWSVGAADRQAVFMPVAGSA